MAFVKNKTLYVPDGSGGFEPFYTVNDELFLTADLIEGLFSFNDYNRAVRSKISKRVARVYLLNKDETIKRDVSEYIVSGNVDFNYQQGQTRSCNITFMNFNQEWLPSPVRGSLWKGSKFRVDVGIYFNGNVYWKQCGIFTPSDPTLNNAGSNKTVSMQMYDKFALLDGTLGGKKDISFKINVGTPVREAINMCLIEDKGNGEQHDYKPLIFPSRYENEVTPYTITKTPNSSIGEIIIELANMISCDVYYNETGNLVLTSGVDNTFLDSKPVLWDYGKSELEYYDTSMVVDFSKIINKVTVLGGIINGKQFKGVAVNDNPKSQTNIYMTEPNAEVIEDSNIVSDLYCEDRAKYELKKKSMLGLQVKLKSIFIPHLLHNEVVRWSNSDYNFKNEKFIIQSLSFDIVGDNSMNISMSNLNEVAL